MENLGIIFVLAVGVGFFCGAMVGLAAVGEVLARVMDHEQRTVDELRNIETLRRDQVALNQRIAESRESYKVLKAVLHHDLYA